MRQFLTLFLLACLAPLLTAAVTPYATQLTISNATGTSSQSYWVDPVSSGNVDSLYYFEGATKIPHALMLGTGLSISGHTLNVAAPSSPTASNQTRTLNSAFQVSTLANSAVRYSVKLTVTASIAGGQEGEIILEQADDSGFTTNVQTLDIQSNGQTYTLAIALQGVQPSTLSVAADYVPAGKYLRIRTNNVTGTPTYSFRNGREVLY